jgi:hypothetical protein
MRNYDDRKSNLYLAKNPEFIGKDECEPAMCRNNQLSSTLNTLLSHIAMIRSHVHIYQSACQQGSRSHEHVDRSHVEPTSCSGSYMARLCYMDLCIKLLKEAYTLTDE